MFEHLAKDIAKDIAEASKIKKPSYQQIMQLLKERTTLDMDRARSVLDSGRYKRLENGQIVRR
jgi:LPS O-antigen subunit length determinant protein (WzzB/FepE family)